MEPKHHTKTRLVLIENDLTYTVYLGENVEVSIKSDRELSKEEIEYFRKYPIKYLEGVSDDI